MIETPENFSRRAKIKGGGLPQGGFTPNSSVARKSVSQQGGTCCATKPAPHFFLHFSGHFSGGGYSDGGGIIIVE